MAYYQDIDSSRTACEVDIAGIVTINTVYWKATLKYTLYLIIYIISYLFMTIVRSEMAAKARSRAIHNIVE